MTDAKRARGQLPVASRMGASATARLRTGAEIGAAIAHRYEVVCRGPDGQEKWRETFANLVVTAGRNDMLDRYYKGSAYTAAHFVGLTDGTPTFAAGDTMASHVGWAEVTGYAEANRPALTMGTVSGGSVDNSGSVASFSINGSATVGGAFVTTNNTKGGTTGTLVGGGAFSGGDRAVAANDTLDVTVTASLTSS